MNDFTVTEHVPIVLGFFAVGDTWNTWVNLYPGIYYTNFEGQYSTVESGYLLNIATLVVGDIAGVIADETPLVPVNSIASLYSFPSFYWDKDTSTLYVRLPDFNSPYAYQMKVGVAANVGTMTYIDEENERLFRGDLLNLPPLVLEKDRIFFKRINIRNFTMELDNSDFRYDDILNWSVYNQPVQYYFGYADEPFSQFVPVRFGRIRDFTFSGNKLVINVNDSRSVLDVDIPPNVFDKTTYTALRDDEEGKTVPIAFGAVRGLEPIVTNGTSATGPYTFKIVDTSDFGPIKDITQVYVEGETVTHAGEDLTNATFTLTAAQCKDGDQFLKVTVDFDSYVDINSALLSNPLDIIVEILDTFLDIPYTNTFYDLTEWNATKLSVPAVAFALTGPTKIKTVIENICVSLRGGMFDQGDGRYTFRIHDDDGLLEASVSDLDWYEMPTIENDSDEVITKVRIGYDKKSGGGNYRIYDEDSLATEIALNYNIRRTERFDTYIKSLTHAQTLAVRIMSISSAPQNIVTGILSLEHYRTFRLLLSKNINAEVNRFINGQFVELLGTYTFEVLRIAPNVLKEQLEVKLRAITPFIGDVLEDTIYTEDDYFSESYFNATFL